jgi:peptidoglycan hydrolase CwlO-like protein
MIRTLEYDKNLDKYVLYIESETDLEHEGKKVGRQTNILKQVWDKDQIGLILKQVENQEDDVNSKISTFKAQISKIGQMTTRERQVIKTFAENLAKAQKLQQIEKIEEDIKNHETALKKILKDKKEIQNAIK